MGEANPEGHSPKWWRKHPEAKVVATSGAGSSEADKKSASKNRSADSEINLSAGDSWTLLGLLIGVLLVLITPTILFKIIALLALCPASFWFCKNCHWAGRWSNRKRNIVGTSCVAALLAVVAPQLLEEWRSREPEKPIIRIVHFYPKYGVREMYSGRRAWVDVDIEDKAKEQAWQVLSISRTRLIPFPAGREKALTMEANIFSELGKDQNLYSVSNTSLQYGKSYRVHAVGESEIPDRGHDEQLGIDDLDGGRAAVFVGGIIRYKNKKGCVYHTYFCGFWRGAGNGELFHEMNLCPGGHNAEAIKTGDECTP